MIKNDITGKTTVVGIIGYPVRHSLSPLMQNKAFEVLGLDYVYVPFEVPPGGLADAVRGMKSLGIAGFNVTIPHKEAIIDFLDGLSPEAEESGAVNVVKMEDRGLIGYNTDGIGLVSSLAVDLSFAPEGATVVMMGAGGAARGAATALCRAGIKALMVVNRTPGNAETLVREVARRYPAVSVEAASLDDPILPTSLERCDLLLNSTSVGMNGTGFSGLDLALMKKSACVYDMVYTPAITPLLRSASTAGLRSANGLGMLAAQGEHAFRIWTGTPPPHGLMKATLVGFLGL